LDKFNLSYENLQQIQTASLVGRGKADILALEEGTLNGIKNILT